MLPELAINDFDFSKHPANQGQLLNAWLPEVEAAALNYLSDDRRFAFMVAILRLIANTKTFKGFNLSQIAEKAGYSRSTFFRIFEGHSAFLLNSYQLSCKLAIKVFERHLYQHEMSLDEFCKFTADVFFGAACAVPSELLQALRKEHTDCHAVFHPHITDLGPVMVRYLSQNAPTQQLKIDTREFDGVIASLDLDMLHARLEDNPLWGTPAYYSKLRKMLHGYFLACA